MTANELFYYLTEAVQVRYSDVEKFVVCSKAKEYITRKEALLEFIKKLEKLYNDSK